MRIEQSKSHVHAHFTLVPSGFMRMVPAMKSAKKRKKKKISTNLTLTDWVAEQSKEMVESELGISLSAFVNMKLMEELAKRGRTAPNEEK